MKQYEVSIEETLRRKYLLLKWRRSLQIIDDAYERKRSFDNAEDFVEYIYMLKGGKCWMKIKNWGEDFIEIYSFNKDAAASNWYKNGGLESTNVDLWCKLKRKKELLNVNGIKEINWFIKKIFNIIIYRKKLKGRYSKKFLKNKHFILGIKKLFFDCLCIWRQSDAVLHAGS